MPTAAPPTAAPTSTVVAGGPTNIPPPTDVTSVVNALSGVVQTLRGVVDQLASIVQAQAGAGALGAAPQTSVGANGLANGGAGSFAGAALAPDATQATTAQWASASESSPPSSPSGSSSGLDSPKPADAGEEAAAPIGGARGGSDKRSEIVKLAEAEIGVKEGSGDARIAEYTKSAGGSGGPWCAYFASWVFNQAGAPLVDSNGDGFTVTIADWGKNNGAWHDKGWTPQQGDLMFFKNSGGNPNYVNHIEIVEKVDADGTIHTIGGNTSDQVKRNTWPPDKGNIVGFVEAPV